MFLNALLELGFSVRIDMQQIRLGSNNIKKTIIKKINESAGLGF